MIANRSSKQNRFSEIIVGASRDDDNGIESGSTYVFDVHGYSYTNGH